MTPLQFETQSTISRLTMGQSGRDLDAEIAVLLQSAPGWCPKPGERLVFDSYESLAVEDETGGRFMWPAPGALTTSADAAIALVLRKAANEAEAVDIILAAVCDWTASERPDAAGMARAIVATLLAHSVTRATPN